MPEFMYIHVISEKWAMCYRKFDHSDVDTNMHIERYVCSNWLTHGVILIFFFFSFHNQHKDNPNFMNGKVNKRVDGLIHILMKYELHTFFNQQTKELMWKYNKKVAREKERHQHGIKIDPNDFKV